MIPNARATRAFIAAIILTVTLANARVLQATAIPEHSIPNPQTDLAQPAHRSGDEVVNLGRGDLDGSLSPKTPPFSVLAVSERKSNSAPEPSTAVLLGAGVVMVVIASRRVRAHVQRLALACRSRYQRAPGTLGRGAEAETAARKS